MLFSFDVLARENVVDFTLIIVAYFSIRKLQSGSRRLLRGFIPC